MSTVSEPLKIATSHQHVLASVTLENAFEGRATATSTMGCCRPVPTQDLTTDSPVRQHVPTPSNATAGQAHNPKRRPLSPLVRPQERPAIPSNKWRFSGLGNEHMTSQSHAHNSHGSDKR